MRNHSGVIAPLSQSRQGDMACGHLYVRKHVLGGPVADSEPAARGTEVHRILAAYINHLVKTKLSRDPGFLDCSIAGAASRDVQQALERFRDHPPFDPEEVLGTELYISLDEEFNPVEPAGPAKGNGENEVRPPAVYEGTLDLVLVRTVSAAEIHDWKSYYQVIEADTFQSKFYPLLLMCLNPSLQQVKFVLEFIRYGASRSVEYTNRDLPWLKELAQRERARQQKLHEITAHDTGRLKASPGRHCTWCPLLLNGCPVAKANPYAQMKAEDRLRLALWLQEAEKQNTKVLRDLLAERGPVRYRDENEAEYLADFVPVEKKFYRFSETSAILEEWLRAHPEDKEFVGTLTVSGLSSPLKAKKRAALAEKLREAAESRLDTELKVARIKHEGISEDGKVPR
jgi:hypothetical protein